MLDPTREDIALHRPELVRLAGDDERLHAAQDDPELLVRVTVGGNRRAWRELDHVQHRTGAEQRSTADSLREYERRDVVEPDELRLHARTLGDPCIVGRMTPIVEQRDYHVHTGRLGELVGLYESEGIAIQAPILGGFVGAFTTEVGALSTYTHLWRYASYEERERRRGELQARDDWQAFLVKVQPLVHTQQNRLLVPTSFSPLR